MQSNKEVRVFSRTIASLVLISSLAGAVGIAPDLLTAAKSGDAAATRTLLAQGADPNMRGEKGATPLMIAAARGHLEVARALLAGGAKPDLQDESAMRMSALHVAAYRGRVEMVRLLLDRGANPTLKDKVGAMASTYAVEAAQNSGAILQLLASKEGGELPDVKSASGSSLALAWILTLDSVMKDGCFAHLESPPCEPVVEKPPLQR